MSSEAQVLDSLELHRISRRDQAAERRSRAQINFVIDFGVQLYFGF